MKKLNIGDVELNSEDVARKVETDIAFLTERINTLELNAPTDPVVLQTYRNMLESRHAVLGWLRTGSEPVAEKKTANG
jgi:hypothetical protein